MLPGIYDEPIERAKDLEQLQAMAGTFKTRRRFLTDLTLDPPSKSERVGLAKKDEEQDFVTISTIHSAKGLEWRSVYVLNVTEGGLPSCVDGAWNATGISGVLLFFCSVQVMCTAFAVWRSTATGHDAVRAPDP